MLSGRKVFLGCAGGQADLFRQPCLRCGAARPFWRCICYPKLNLERLGRGAGKLDVREGKPQRNFSTWGGPRATIFHTIFFFFEFGYHRGNRLCTSPTTVFFFFPSPPYICKRRLIKRLNKRSLLVNLQETKPSTCDASKRPRATSLPQKSQLSAADWKIKSSLHKNFTPIVMQ